LQKRLIENHKPKKLALIAAMRKLVLIAHAVYKNKVEFSIACLKEKVNQGGFGLIFTTVSRLYGQ